MFAAEEVVPPGSPSHLGPTVLWCIRRGSRNTVPLLGYHLEHFGWKGNGECEEEINGEIEISVTSSIFLISSIFFKLYISYSGVSRELVTGHCFLRQLLCT